MTLSIAANAAVKLRGLDPEADCLDVDRCGLGHDVDAAKVATDLDPVPEYGSKVYRIERSPR